MKMVTLTVKVMIEDDEESKLSNDRFVYRLLRDALEEDNCGYDVVNVLPMEDDEN